MFLFQTEPDATKTSLPYKGPDRGTTLDYLEFNVELLDKQLGFLKSAKLTEENKKDGLKRFKDNAGSIQGAIDYLNSVKPQDEGVPEKYLEDAKKSGKDALASPGDEQKVKDFVETFSTLVNTWLNTRIRNIEGLKEDLSTLNTEIQNNQKTEDDFEKKGGFSQVASIPKFKYADKYFMGMNIGSPDDKQAGEYIAQFSPILGTLIMGKDAWLCFENGDFDKGSVYAAATLISLCLDIMAIAAVNVSGGTSLVIETGIKGALFRGMIKAGLVRSEEELVLKYANTGLSGFWERTGGNILEKFIAPIFEKTAKTVTVDQLTKKQGTTFITKLFTDAFVKKEIQVTSTELGTNYITKEGAQEIFRSWVKKNLTKEGQDALLTKGTWEKLSGQIFSQERFWSRLPNKKGVLIQAPQEVFENALSEWVSKGISNSVTSELPVTATRQQISEQVLAAIDKFVTADGKTAVFRQDFLSNIQTVAFLNKQNLSDINTLFANYLNEVKNMTKSFSEIKNDIKYTLVNLPPKLKEKPVLFDISLGAGSSSYNAPLGSLGYAGYIPVAIGGIVYTGWKFGSETVLSSVRGLYNMGQASSYLLRAYPPIFFGNPLFKAETRAAYNDWTPTIRNWISGGNYQIDSKLDWTKNYVKVPDSLWEYTKDYAKMNKMQDELKVMGYVDQLENKQDVKDVVFNLTGTTLTFQMVTGTVKKLLLDPYNIYLGKEGKQDSLDSFKEFIKTLSAIPKTKEEQKKEDEKHEKGVVLDTNKIIEKPIQPDNASQMATDIWKEVNVSYGPDTKEGIIRGLIKESMTYETEKYTNGKFYRWTPQKVIEYCIKNKDIKTKDMNGQPLDIKNKEILEKMIQELKTVLKGDASIQPKKGILTG